MRTNLARLLSTLLTALAIAGMVAVAPSFELRALAEDRQDRLFAQDEPAPAPSRPPAPQDLDSESKEKEKEKEKEKVGDEGAASGDADCAGGLAELLPVDSTRIALVLDDGSAIERAHGSVHNRGPPRL